MQTQQLKELRNETRPKRSNSIKTIPINPQRPVRSNSFNIMKRKQLRKSLDNNRDRIMKHEAARQKISDEKKLPNGNKTKNLITDLINNLKRG